MKPKKPEKTLQVDLFRMKLDQMLDQRHELYRLAGRLDWQAAEEQFGMLYSEEGRPGDLPPSRHTSMKLVKSVFREENGREEAFYRRTNHWVSEAGRGGDSDQGSVPQRRLQRRDVLQVALKKSASVCRVTGSLARRRTVHDQAETPPTITLKPRPRSI